ncbi:hypothetical protein FB566_4888 [Stackebrandtia endophytica]|uniref:Uncharacterized protein n=1 Tax=Stackebrandtia endophytica TaxID=1496996 RepID=A0A543B381_9ACTN|nr:hypothetical protein FB566_4888 [Stackebrandtia endophytica]
MIVGSLLLLVAGAGFLITGLAIGNDSFLIGTIAASLLAAVCLYVGSRPARRPEERLRDRDEYSLDRQEDDRLRSTGRRRYDADEWNRADDPDGIPSGRGSGREDYLDIDVDTSMVPSDEPGEVPMSSVEAAALMRMDTEVEVVDGRPRFHLGGCVHLIGRDSESLPAYEAVELGFSACALCRPAQSLLREPTHR